MKTIHVTRLNPSLYKIGYPFSQEVLEHLFMCPDISVFWQFDVIIVTNRLIESLKSDFKVIIHSLPKQLTFDFDDVL